MKKNSLRLWADALLGLTLLLLVPGCQTPGASQPLRLRVMTYNIRIGVGGGEWHTDPQRVNLEPVARVIAKHAPDIVGLQEVDQSRPRSASMDQPAWLSERLKMYVAFAPAYSVTNGTAPVERYGVALLARHDILAHKRIPLFKTDYRQSHPEYPGYFSEQRALLVAPVKVGNRIIHVLVTHLGLTADQRAEQVKQIAEAAARIPGPKILLGDFNAPPTEPVLSALQESLQDALTVVGTTPEDRKSYPGGLQPKGAIDYIFVSPEFRVLNARVIRDATLASDHNPVVAELELSTR